jgi:hypothetical protein
MALNHIQDGKRMIVPRIGAHRRTRQHIPPGKFNHHIQHPRHVCLRKMGLFSHTTFHQRPFHQLARLRCPLVLEECQKQFAINHGICHLYPPTLTLNQTLGTSTSRPIFERRIKTRQWLQTGGRALRKQQSALTPQTKRTEQGTVHVTARQDWQPPFVLPPLPYPSLFAQTN